MRVTSPARNRIVRFVESRRSVLVLGAAFLAIAALLTKHHAMTWNDNSRMATIDALAVHHTFALDGLDTFVTGDKYRYAGNFYSDKPPMLAIAGAGLALALERAGLSIERRPGLAYYALTVALVAVAYAGGLMALYSTLRLFASAVWAACITICAGGATLLLPYATVLNNHVVSGALVAVALRALVGRRPGVRGVALAGAALALAAAVDLSFAIFLVLAPLLLVRHGLRRTIVPFTCAAAPIVAAYFALNVLLSGSVVPPALDLPLWHYPGSEFDRTNLTGFAGQRSLADHARYAFDLLVGNHGLFAYTPIFALSVYALAVAWRERRDRRFELAFVGIGCAAYVAAYVWTSDDYGGYSYGIRWYAGIAFVAMYPLAFLEGAVRRSKALRWIFLAAVLVSSIAAVVGVADPFSPDDRGLAPFAYNVALLVSGPHHAVKLAISVLLVAATFGVVERLVRLVRVADTAGARIVEAV